MIALYAQRGDWDIGEPRVDVSYDTDADPRRFDVTVELPERLSADQLERLRRVADTCPVRRALEGRFEFCEWVEPEQVGA